MARMWKRHILKLWTFSLTLWTFLFVTQENSFWNLKGMSIRGDIKIKVDPENTITSRRNHIAQYCATHYKEDILHDPHNPTLNGVFVADHRRRFLCALIFKVGSSTLLRAFMNSSSLVPKHKLQAISNVHINTPEILKKYGIDTISSRDRTFIIKYQSYFKFIFVRNPYHRLISAFRNKLKKRTMKGDWWYEMTINRIRKYRTDAGPTLFAKLKETEVTFEEFLRYVLDDIKKYNTTDDHWKPLYRLSMPCMVKYDFVGKFETFNEDFRLLMPHINITDVPRTKVNPATGPSTTKVFQEYWKQVPQALAKEIEGVFEKDFDMFQYNKRLADYF